MFWGFFFSLDIYSVDNLTNYIVFNKVCFSATMLSLYFYISLPCELLLSALWITVLLTGESFLCTVIFEETSESLLHS